MDDMDEIYRRHARTVYKFLLAQCRDPDLAEELTQETFYQAVRSIHRFDGSCKLSVWLCQIAKHLWYRHLRKHRRESGLETAPEGAAPSAEDGLMEREGRLALLRLIHRLPELQREVVYLRAFGGLSFREIVVISRLTLDLLEAQSPYCGDPAAPARIAKLLRLENYAVSLQTSEHPYSWTLEFSDRLGERQYRLASLYSLVALALTDNLEGVLFTCPGLTDGAQAVSSGVYLEEASQLAADLTEEYNAAHGTDWEPKASVKEYAQSPADLQRLLLILENFYHADLNIL